ncbi:MAG: hypothetical protein U0694_21875 [Anaerolineae bacterium]
MTDYRQPLERDRDAIVGRVNERSLRRTLSKDDLRGLLTTLEPALAKDPVNFNARKAREDVLDRLNELEVAADLDAVRIYMESANWERAADLLAELLPRSRGDMTTLIHLLTDCAALLNEHRNIPQTQAAQDAITLLFDRDFAQAARILLIKADDKARPLHLLLAERISAYVPDVVLLRPNLYRVEIALKALAKQPGIAETRALLTEIQASLDKLAGNSAVLVELRDGYRAIVDQLTGLSTLLETFNASQNLPDEQLPLSALERASIAAMALADNMHVIGKQATSSPRDALQALDSCRAIDPMNAAWDAIERLLDGLYELLQSYQTYIPAADGSDLEGWLQESRRDLAPFVDRLFDEMLTGMVGGLEIAERAWNVYAEEAIQGNRLATVTALTQAADAVATISPTLSGWLNQLRTIISNAHYIERHALHGGLGRALADGWEAFDRGRLQDAERLGQQAYEIARSENERFAAKRLRDLSTATYSWTERGGINSTKTSQITLVNIEELYTEEENDIRQSFAAQMPSKETYLRAMQKGIVEIYNRSSTASVRILFANCILLGALDAHDGALDDAAFWREVGARSMGEIGPRHTLTRLLDEYLTRRRDVIAATTLLNNMHNAQAFSNLETARRQLEDGAQARVLAGAIQSLRELEGVIRDWADGEFRAAGIKLENAINSVNEVEQTAQTTLTTYRAWLMELQSHAAELYNINRQMRQAVERRPVEPVDVVREAHRRQAEVTAQVLGDRHAATLRQWYETYEAFLNVYSDSTVRRTQKLNKFNELFKAMFIDRHPAYPLYRLWYETTERAPEFPAPPTSEPTPKIREDETIDPEDYRPKPMIDGEELSGSLRERLASVPARTWLLIPIVVVFVLVVAAIAYNAFTGVQAAAQAQANSDATNTAGAILIAASRTNEASQQPLSTEDATEQSSEAEGNLVSTQATLPVFDTPTPRVATVTGLPPAISATPTPTRTELPPTATDTPTLTYTPSITPTPSSTPTATLPAQGLQGEQNVLTLLNSLPADVLPWDAEQFGLVTDNDGSQYWRLGRGTVGDGIIAITLPEDLLETYYGNNAATRIYRMEVEFSLASYNPPLVVDGQVIFGALLQSLSQPPAAAGFEVQVVDTNVINLGQRSAGFDNPDAVTVLSQRSVSAVIVSVRLERDRGNGGVVLFINGNPLGNALTLTSAQDAILPTIYVHDGGVIVYVTRWTITLG